jgi:hypothetical protein
MLTELIDLIYNVISSICVLFPYYSIDTVHSIFGVSKQEKKKHKTKEIKAKKERQLRLKEDEEKKKTKKKNTIKNINMYTFLFWI